MEQETKGRCMPYQREKEGLKRLYLLEDLAAKKSKIYSKLLTDVGLAKTMQKISDGHEQRKQALLKMMEEI